MNADGNAIPLARLKGYRIAEGAPDPRSWDVYSADGRRIGDVYDVLVDASTRCVAYLDVEVENIVVTGRERHVLIPVTRVRTSPDLRRTVIVEGIPARAMAEMPAYTRGTAVYPAHPAVAPLSCAMEPDPMHEPLELPIRVERPLIIRPIRMPSKPVPAQPAPAETAAAGSRAA